MKYGPNTETIEAFIQHLKGMTPEQWATVNKTWETAWDAALDAALDAARDAAWDAGDAAWTAAWDAARKTARDAAWKMARDAASDAAWDAAEVARDVAWGAAAAWAARHAVYEILGASLMRERGQPFYCLPMFGCASPEAVLETER